MSTKKLPYMHPSLMAERVFTKNDIQTWSRATTIDESFVSKKFRVHNGKIFVDVIVNSSMVGYKLGEFARTRRRGKDPRPKASRISSKKK